MNKYAILLLAAFAGLPALSAAPARAQEQTTLEKLMAQNKVLTEKTEEAEKTKGEIAKAILVNNGAQAALKGAVEKLRHAGMGVIDEQKKIDEQARRAGCPWGATLRGQDAFVVSCNKEADRLNGLMEEVKKQHISLQDYARELDKAQTEVSNTATKLEQQKHKNESDLQVYAKARAVWAKRYQEFLFQSPTYERLKKTDPGAKLCDELSLPETHEALKRASQCLQWVWDGARR